MTVTETNSAASNPHVVIYQNPDFVGGLLQELLNEGLLVSGESESTRKDSSGNTQTKSGGANLAAKAALPVAGGLEGSLDAALGKTSNEGTETAATARRQYSYDLAYYLQLLKQRLAGQIVEIDAKEDADGLMGGEIVVYTGRFRANEINALLDIATPDLVAAATKFFVRRSARPHVDDDNFDIAQLKYDWEVSEQEATRQADLAYAATRAVRTDFRSENTREFYCDLGEDLTAVTVCDAAHFITDDQDRLLDGRFTVLGKVITPLEEDVPVFGRNKILKRLNPDFVVSVFDQLFDSVGSSVPHQQQLRNLFDEGTDTPPIDLKFSAKIEGPSFAVLPIAIYI